jgi:hypothetical protein
MSEKSEKLALLSETEILLEFRKALVALYPSFVKLDCLENDAQPYDDFDQVAECLWDVFVVKSLQWKYGLDKAPQLPRYGFSSVGEGADGFIQVNFGDKRYKFVSFHGNRAFGEDSFNCIGCEKLPGYTNYREIHLDDTIKFEWRRKTNT